MSRSSNNPRVEIGGVARAHGIRGEILIFTHDPESTILGVISTLWIGGAPYVIDGARDATKGWLVQLDGIADRNAAELLRGKPVEVERDQLDLDPDDVLLADLVGCQVQRVDGTPWGTIAEVDVGPQTMLIIHDGKIERMLPLVDALVVKIDLEARLVTVDPPEGLPEHLL